MPARILVISAVYPPMKAPEGDHVMHLCRHITDAGSEVHLLTSVDADPRGNPRVYTIPGWGWRAMPRILRCIRQVKPDAIMIMYVGWMYHSHPMITLLPAMVKRLFPKIERVVMITNAIGSVPAATARSKMAWQSARMLVGGADPEFGTLLRDCSRICILSEHHLAALVAREPLVTSKAILVPPPPILHMSPATPATRVKARARLGVAEDELLFTFFGYSYPGKGVETFIRAFILLADLLPKAKLMIAGRMVEVPDAEGRPYGTMLRELASPLGSRMITTEFDANSDEGSAFLRATDVCVLPFDNGIQLNNSSLSAALVHGMPIVSTRGQYLESPFIDGRNLLLCPPKSPNAMAEAMIRLANDTALRAALSAGASQLATEWFAWERTLELLFSRS